MAEIEINNSLKLGDARSLRMKDGTVINFTIFQPKEKNLIKLNLNYEGEDSEGVWACLSDEDKVKYESDYKSEGYEAMATLRNDALLFMPNRSWGLCVPVKFNGSERPTCDISKFELNTPEQLSFINLEHEAEDAN